MKHPISTKIIVTILLLFSIFLQGQELHKIIENNQLKFEKISAKDGLIHNSITAIHQDSKGYMWFGTFNGLYKYDGYNFTIYKNVPGDTSTLIGNDIITITEDRKGIIWIGTKSGVCHYHRDKDLFQREIKTSNAPINSIIKHKTNRIYEDSYGIIWLGTSHGLYKLTPNNETYKIDIFKSEKSKNSISNNYVKDIIEDKNNDLWIGTKNGLNKVTYNRQGALLFNVFNSNSKDPTSISHSNITSFCEDNQGNLWVGTINGLNKLALNNYDLKFDKYFHNPDEELSLAHNHITTIKKDSNNTLWIGTRYGGVSRFFPQKNQFVNYKKDLQNDNTISTNEISSIFEGRNGILWIGGVAGALNKIDLNKKRIAHFKYINGDPKSLSDNKINILFEDESEHLWIGTINGGLNKLYFKDNGVHFIHYKYDPNNENSLSSNNIFSFCQDNYGNFWAGTENEGLNQIKIEKSDLDNIQIKRYSKTQNQLPSNNISVLFKDRTGDIWMSSFDGDGLMKFTPNKFNETLPEISHFTHDPGNANSLSSNNISCLFEDSESILWAGTYGGGLVKIQRDSTNTPVNFITIKNNPSRINSLSSNNVFSIHEDKNSDLWIGTYGGGLNKLSKKEKHNPLPELNRYGKKEGLSNDELYGILEDQKENLWISSNNGIYQFNLKNETFVNLQVNDGVQALNFRKFAYCKGNNGIMYFGGINGFNIFYPDEFTTNIFTPTVEITDFKIFNEIVTADTEVSGSIVLDKAISETESIELQSAHKAFSFEFSGLHYSSPAQNNYAYMLEGFDKDWNYTTSKRRYAAYSNINAGNYIFKVKASNNDNLWNEHPKEIKITVLPAIYNTWWAYSCYAAFALLLIFLFRKHILLNADYENKLKIEKLEQQNIKNINKMKLEFFTNISHEFKTPLTLILGPLQNLMLSNDLKPKDQKSLSMMERNANQLYRLIIQVIEFRKIENKELKIEKRLGDFVKFCKEVLDTFQFLADKKQLNLNFISSKNEAQVYFDWDKLEKILNNLISNAIKNTHEKGKVTFELTFHEQNETVDKVNQIVTLKIKDNGVGIPENHTKLIFDRFHQIDNLNLSNSQNSGIGLAFTKTLVKLNKGEIWVKSKVNIGTEFTISFPLHHETNSLNVHIDQGSYKIKNENNRLDNNEYSAMYEPVENASNDKDLPLLLVVEDSSELQQFIKDSLKEHFKIIQEFNGEDGLKSAISKVPDIIISDVMMPFKNGIELCREIKINNITNHIPIILLTAKSAIEHQIEGIQVGADAYISKPFNTIHLLVRLQKLLEQRSLLKDKFSLNAVEHISINDERIAEKEFFQKINEIVEKNIDNPQFDVETLGKELNFSKMQLYRKLKSISSLTASELIREYRIRKAAFFIKDSEMNISEIAYSVGFSSLSYFTKCFKKVYTMSPTEYAKKQKKAILKG